MLGMIATAFIFRPWRANAPSAARAVGPQALPVASARLTKPIRVVLAGCVEKKLVANLWYPSLRSALQFARPASYADLSKVTVVRVAGRQRVKFSVNAEKLLADGGEAFDIELADGDAIFVPEKLI